jgi:lysophospholipase L1-like esterase
MGENLVLGLFVLLPLVCGGLLVLWVHFSRKGWAATPWVRRPTASLLLLLSLLSLVALAGEVYYRFIFDQSAIGVDKIATRWFQRHYHLNSWGFRDNVDYVNALQPGRRRVTFLGDSFTAGWGVNNVEECFAGRLRHVHPDWEIHVLARPGFDTGNELNLLSDRLDKGYQIDQVVLVYVLNDIEDLVPELHELQVRIFGEIARAGWLRRNSFLLNLLYMRLILLRSPLIARFDGITLEAYKSPAWEQQRQRLKAVRDLVQGRGGRLCVVTFPFLRNVGPINEIQSVHSQLDGCWHELNVPHLDLLPVFRNLPARKVIASPFDDHPNAYAHQLAAQALDPFLRQQLATKP